MKPEFPGTYDFPFCTQNPVSLLVTIFWEQPCHCLQDRSPLFVHYIHLQFPLFRLGWVSDALPYLPGGSAQFPTGMLESRAWLPMLCQRCKPRLPSASLGSAAQHSCTHTSAPAAGHRPWCTERWRGIQEASPGPQQGTDCALLETCSVRLCSSACHWSCAFGRPCICSVAVPPLSWDISSLTNPG